MCPDRMKKSRFAFWIILCAGSVLVTGFILYLSRRSDTAPIVAREGGIHRTTVINTLPIERSNPPPDTGRETMAPVNHQNGGDRSVAMPEFEPLEGAACYVWGVVSNEDEKPVTGASVTLSLRFDDFSDPVKQDPVVTDERGLYLAAVPLPFDVLKTTWLGNIESEIYAECSAEGYETTEDAEFLDFDCSKNKNTVRMDLDLYEELVVQGRVVDMQGRPVKGASVFVIDPQYPADHERWIETDLNGGFAFQVDEFTRHSHRFTAIKPGVGIAAPVDYTVKPDQDQRIPDLRLRRADSIRGRVVNPGGEPIEGVELHAYPKRLIFASDEELENAKDDYFRKLGLLTRKSSGYHYSTARSGPDGRFRLAGLEEGEYFILAGALYERNFRPPVEQSRVLYRTGGEEIDLVLDLYTIEITLVDQNGRLISNGRIISEVNGMKYWDNFVGGRYRRQIAPGTVSLLALRGDVDFGPEFIECRRTFSVPNGQYHTRKKLVLEQVLFERFWIEFTQDGRRLVSKPPIDRIRIFSKAGSLHLRDKDLLMNPIEISLPPANYQIEVWPVGCSYPLLFESRRPGHMYLYQGIDGIAVGPGEQNIVIIDLKIGGRIGLILNTQQGAGATSQATVCTLSLDEVRKRFPPTGRASKKDRKLVDFRALLYGNNPFYRIELTSVPIGGSRIIEHYFSWDPISHDHLYDIKANKPYLNQSVLEPGEYDLAIVPKGYLPIITRIRIVPDQITLVAVHLQERP